jgi:LysM repeat protein
MGTSSDSLPAGLQPVTPGTITPAPASGTTHVVADGDSLWDLATKYNTSVKSIQEANNLTGDKIILGQTLIIPGSGGTAIPSSTNPVTSPPTTITTIPSTPTVPTTPTVTPPSTTVPTTLPPEPPALQPTIPPPPSVPSVPSAPVETLPPVPPTDVTVPGAGFGVPPTEPSAPSGFQINP